MAEAEGDVRLELYSGMLKMMSNFDRPECITPVYNYECENAELAMRYDLGKVAGEGSELTQALNLLNWLSSNTFHSGEYDNSIPFNALDLLEYTFGQPIGKGVNCMALSKILTECCLAVGLKARIVYIMPFNPYEADNHVVTVVFVQDLDKWVMLDPSYNAYMMDSDGVILSPWEARQVLAEQGEIRLNDGYNYNGDYTGEVTGETHGYYVEYIAKDLFWFIGEDGSGQQFYVAPVGYDAREYFIANIEYRIREFGESEGLVKWLEKVKGEDVGYVSLGEFGRRPYYL